MSKNTNRGSLVASASRRAWMMVAGLMLALAMALAPASRALAYSNDTMYRAQALTSGRGVIQEFETSNPFSEEHWFKFKTSGRRSVYSVRIQAIDGRNVGYIVKDADGNRIAEGYSRTVAVKFLSNLNVGAWYYVDIIGNRFINSEAVPTKQYDQFKITVTEHPILKKVSTPTATAARNSAKVTWRTQANATHYRVYYRAKTKSGWGAWRQRTFTAKVKSCTLTGLKSKTYYQICVRAYRKGGWNWDKDTKSDWSDLSNARTIKTK